MSTSREGAGCPPAEAGVAPVVGETVAGNFEVVDPRVPGVHADVRDRSIISAIERALAARATAATRAAAVRLGAV